LVASLTLSGVFESPGIAEAMLVLLPAMSALLARLVDTHSLPDLTQRLALDGPLSPEEAELRDHLNAFLDRVHRDFVDLGRTSNDAARGAAANTYLLGQIAAAAQEQSDRTAEVSAAVHQVAIAAQVVAESSEATRTLTTDVGAASVDALNTLEHAIARLEELRAKAEQALADVRTVVEYSQQIGAVTNLIDEISSRTNLLAINASIEAAHAGDTGRGFRVVAQEIKRLADSTKKSARDISALIKSVSGAIESARVATLQNEENVAAFSSESLEVRDDLTKVTTIIETSGDQVSAIAAAVEEQSTTLREVSGNIESLNRHAQQAAEHAAEARGLDLGAINSAVFSVIGRYRLGTFVDSVRDWAIEMAEATEAVLEGVVQSGAASLTDMLDPQYEEYTPFSATQLAPLFNIARMPPQGFKPPKYHTKVDHLFDRALMPICDACADRDAKIVYASICDLNAFSVMSSRELRKDITGDYARDLAGNRIKRFFEDDLGMRAARVGLGEQAIAAGKRLRRKALTDAGVDVRRPPGVRPWLVQTYARDTGKIYDDFALALYCGGLRWGTLRVGFEPVV
jgi:methyl-accepting chemotaxis protein